MIDPQLSKYGFGPKQLSDAVLNPAAKYFFVGNTTLAFWGEVLSFLGPDADGGNRVFSTLAACISDANTVAGRGDYILIAPGHAETITAAAGIAISESGMTIMGLGTGALRPTFTFTTSTAASFDITAASVTIKNCIFVSGIDAQTAMVNVNATDATFTSCEFRTNSGTVGATLGLLIGGTSVSDRFVVNQCRFLGPATNTGTTTTAQIQYEQAVDGQITNSYFTGKMTQAILNVTGTVLRGLIQVNTFVISTGTKGIAVASASTPMITNNRFNVASGTAPIVAAAGFVIGNLYSAAAGVTAPTAATF